METCHTLQIHLTNQMLVKGIHATNERERERVFILVSSYLCQIQQLSLVSRVQLIAAIAKAAKPATTYPQRKRFTSVLTRLQSHPLTASHLSWMQTRICQDNDFIQKSYLYYAVIASCIHNSIGYVDLLLLPFQVLCEQWKIVPNFKENKWNLSILMDIQIVP